MRQQCLGRRPKRENDHDEINNLKSAATEKLRLDFVGVVGTCPDMVDDSHSEFAVLVQRLCLEAGRIMEDESPTLAMSLPRSGDGIAARMACIRKAGEDIAALIGAAEVIARRAGTGI